MRVSFVRKRGSSFNIINEVSDERLRVPVPHRENMVISIDRGPQLDLQNTILPIMGSSNLPLVLENPLTLNPTTLNPVPTHITCYISPVIPWEISSVVKWEDSSR